jgi:hypothetical protein
VLRHTPFEPQRADHRHEADERRGRPEGEGCRGQ